MDELEAIFHQLGVVIRELEKLRHMLRQLEAPLRRVGRAWPALRDLEEALTPCLGKCRDRLRRFDVVYRQASRYVRNG